MTSQTAEDIQEALKDLLGSTLKEMMGAEMDDHLGYERGRKFFCVFKIGSSIQLELDM